MMLMLCALLRLFVAVLQTNTVATVVATAWHARAITSAVCVSYENITMQQQQHRKHACLTAHHRHSRMQHLWKVMVDWQRLACWFERARTGCAGCCGAVECCLCFCSNQLPG
jgi:hypothetical protein